jgi:hypothetical protein
MAEHSGSGINAGCQTQDFTALKAPLPKLPAYGGLNPPDYPQLL